ncbi:hypothetical protein [Sulfuricurvum sp.]|uniref:hypothetical protein n=1 Tax=Sulfuricurvum sp. TaxID=2025608 RepID=UPI002E31CBF5|nr:hypothetical protein [Sulfuricurvum sp.]HEX5330805.1 hypothetical protein [Sulfuricurvum sp.]
MNYKSYPTDFIQQLKRERGVAGRKKARAFMEFWDDMEHGDHNSESFYAKSWDISRSTSHEWIKEFKVEMDLFVDHMFLKNQQHYNHAIFPTEQNEQLQPSKTSNDKHRNIGTYTTSTEQNEQLQPREAFNLNDNNHARELRREWWNDGEFQELFFIYSQNTRFVGKKEDAFEQFTRTEMNPSILILSAVQYLHDPAVGGKHYNLANFLKNETYLSYIPKMIKVQHGDQEIIGEYDRVNHRIIENGSNRVIVLTPERLVELFKVGALEFIKPVGRAA